MKGTVNLFLFGGMICLCVLWITQNNVYTKIGFIIGFYCTSGRVFINFRLEIRFALNLSKLLESDFYDDMFEGSADDDYRPNCKPNKNDDDTIKFGGLDPCQVHVQIMDILHASGRKTKKWTINHFYSSSNNQNFDFTEFR